VLANTVDGLVVPDLFTLSNSRKQPFASSNFRSEKEVRSLYGFGSFGYSDIVFLDWSLRNDWSSALPADNNSYLYPSVGTSFIFSELTEEALPFLSFGKFRASWAQVGSDLAAYSTSLTYAVGTDQWNGNIVTATPNRQVDPNIKPSLSSAYELGIDLKFLKNRAGFNFTYYSESKVDEILEVPISGTSGYTSKLINAGQIDRSGIEVTLEGNPVQAGAFRWDVTLNLARQRSEIVELTEGIDAVPFGSGDVFGVAAVYNAVGEEWGQIRGFGITYKNGQPVLNSSGLYVTTPNMYHGSVLPDFTGGLINSLTYKNFALTFNIDFQSGGKFWSLSDAFGTFSGLTARTAGLNEAGVPTRDAVADGGGVHVVGIDETTEAPVEYDIEAKEYYQQFFNSSIVDNSLYDLSFVKLREVNLSYMIPVAKLGVDRVFTSASVGFVARNLWLMYSKVDDFDPAEISAAFGENGQFPSIRSYGFNLKLNF
jgi:outer membrane receptor protein involved in Fe transport